MKLSKEQLKIEQDRIEQEVKNSPKALSILFLIDVLLLILSFFFPKLSSQGTLLDQFIEVKKKPFWRDFFETLIIGLIVLFIILVTDRFFGRI